MNILFTLSTFLLTLALLVTVHEFGHFWVARRLGVKVLRFSLGFGKPLWRYLDKHGTEYVIAAIPFGGYVQMLNEQGNEVIAEQDKDKSFDSKPLLYKSAIVSAGPLFNILFAILVYWAMFLIGAPAITPVVGQVEPNSIAAAAGIKANDKIIVIDDEPASSWQVVIRKLLGNIGSQRAINIIVDNEQGTFTYSLDLNRLTIRPGEENLVAAIGIQSWQPEISTTLESIVADSPAQRAGLQAGDIVMQVNGDQIEDGRQLIDYSNQFADQTMRLQVRRGQQYLLIDVVPEKVAGIGRIGAQLIAEVWPEDMITVQRYSFFEAFPQALRETWRITHLSMVMLGKLITGKVPVQSLSGPVGIAVGSSETFSAGITYYLGFLALVSIGLAILNILPIPMLDGGHLLFYVIEAITGKAISVEIRLLLVKISLFLLLFLMLFTIYNDLSRYILN